MRTRTAIPTGRSTRTVMCTRRIVAGLAAALAIALPAHADTVMERFATRGLACAVIGDIDATREVVVEEAAERLAPGNGRRREQTCCDCAI